MKWCIKTKGARKTLFIILSCIILASLTACRNGNDSNSASPVVSETPATSASSSPGTDVDQKYADPVTVNLGLLSMGKIFNGDTLENNAFTRWIEETTNIQVKHKFAVSSENINQRVNLAIASNDLPDAMIVNDQNQLNQLIESGMVEDLTDVWDKYASPLLKDIVNSHPGGQPMKTVTKNGKIMAIPGAHPSYQYSLVWIREDWMKKIGAQPPKTMDELVNLAKAFVDKDPAGLGQGKTYGMALATTVAGNYNNPTEIDPIFNYFQAYPKTWKKDATGSYTYGSIQPEVKQALSFAADMYKKGIFSKEFATADTISDIAAGKVGIVCGAWWIPGWPLGDSMKNNPNATWIPVKIPSPDGNYYTYSPEPTNQWIVVKKGFKHPEAVIKLINYSAESQFSANSFLNKFPSTIPTDVLNYYSDKGTPVDWGYWNFHVELRYYDEQIKNAEALVAAVDNGTTDGLSPAGIRVVETIQEYVAGNHDLVHAIAYQSNYSGFKAMLGDNLKILDNGFPGLTKSMKLKWANLTKLESQAYLKIIMGEQPIDYFDTFVKNWKSQGGDEITTEVNQAIKGE